MNINIKDNILKKLYLDNHRDYDSYKEFKNKNMSCNEWINLCDIINEMKQDGFIHGSINHENPNFEIYITQEGITFIRKGGYRCKFFKKFSIGLVIAILTLIVTLLSYLKT